MAHVHTHEHQHGSYYLDQLLIVAFSGALGVIMILLYQFDVLSIFLDKKFHGPLIWGAAALLVLVVIRAISLWVAVGRTQAAHEHSHDEEHEHDHDHEHCHHDHDHEHCDHDHDHAHTHAAADDCGHDHGFAPWRYMVLMVPVALFLVRMPWPAPPEKVPANIIPLTLTKAEQTANDPQQREFQIHQTKDDKRVQLKGKISNPWNSDRMFSFVRLRMTCCYADAYGEPVKIVVETPKHPINYELVNQRSGWVRVIGKIDYRQLVGGQYVTVLKADSWEALKKPPVNQFDN